MTLRKAKEEIALRYGEKDWTRLVWHFDVPNIEIALDKAAELYAQSKVSEALKLAESLAEKEKRDVWDRACEAQKQICANSANAIVFMGTGVVHKESILQAQKPEYKP